MASSGSWGVIVFLPNIVILYLFISSGDSGYMARSGVHHG